MEASMRSIFENGPIEITGKNDRVLIVRKDGFSLNTGKNEVSVLFDDVRYTNVTRYCNANSSYIVMLVMKDGKNIEIDTDITPVGADIIYLRQRLY